MSCERRPYGLTEDDYAALEHCRNSLRMAQYYCAAAGQGPMEPDLLFSFYSLLDEKLSAVLSSANAAPPSTTRSAKA